MNDATTKGTWQPFAAVAGGPRKVSVAMAMQEAFQADARVRWAGIDPDDFVETVAEEVQGRLDRRRPRRKAAEVARVLSLLDDLEVGKEQA